MRAGQKLRVLGIMSGTSLDGVDFALCEVAGGGIRLLNLWSERFPKSLQGKLQEAAGDRLSTHALGLLHHQLGRFYAEAAPTIRRLDLVGLHGQTVFHNGKAGATLQIGEPAWLCERFRVPVVNNFRSGDIAAGGQGAPLATLFHQVVFARRGCHVCMNNLGGISNVTSLDGRRIQSFDTGPGNMLIDLAMSHFTNGKARCDEDGRWARRGIVHEGVLRKWLKHPYFRSAPPKSTGRELFGEPFLRSFLSDAADLSKDDCLATLTRFTAESILLNYRLHLNKPPDEVILAGGGAKNPVLVENVCCCLHGLWPQCSLSTTLDYGWPLESIEPAAFALLAYRRFFNLPGNIPSTTGARRAVVLGQITCP